MFEEELNNLLSGVDFHFKRVKYCTQILAPVPKFVITFCIFHLLFHLVNGTAHLKNVNNYLNTDIYSYLETSGGQSSNLYLNVVHFFNTRVN